jgi:methylglyoxal synthase
MEIAIIAHDGKKDDLVKFLIKNREVLQQESISL